MPRNGPLPKTATAVSTPAPTIVAAAIENVPDPNDLFMAPLLLLIRTFVRSACLRLHRFFIRTVPERAAFAT
jgi:hypothetical protein